MIVECFCFGFEVVLISVRYFPHINILAFQFDFRISNVVIIRGWMMLFALSVCATCILVHLEVMRDYMYKEFAIVPEL